MQDLHREILDTHGDLIVAVIDSATELAGVIDSWPVSDSEMIRVPLERSLRADGLLVSLLDMLDTGAEALGETIQGQPVAAPPYLVITSRGPMCRGTLSNGRRLIIELRLFAVEGHPRRYRFRAPDPETCLRVQCQ